MFIDLYLPRDPGDPLWDFVGELPARRGALGGDPRARARTRPGQVLRALVGESVKAITEDGAHTIVFGCTGMFGYARKVEDALGGLGYGGVPVLDPIPTAVRLARSSSTSARPTASGRTTAVRRMG